VFGHEAHDQDRIARIAGAAAATRLLVRNPNTPPSKLLSRDTIAEQRLPRQEGFSQGRQDRVAEEQVEAEQELLDKMVEVG
jgi:hypothetical protein